MRPLLPLLASLLAAQGRHFSAREVWLELLRREDFSESGTTDLIKALRESARIQFEPTRADQVLPMLQESLRRHPEQQAVRAAVGFWLWQSGKTVDARRLFESLMREDIPDVVLCTAADFFATESAYEQAGECLRLVSVTDSPAFWTVASKLREAVGPVIGANLDPSHLFWMGADPLVAAEALGEAIYHVHAKDTLLNAPVQATTSLLENGSLMDIPARSWSYITLGFGHGEEWWRQFCYRLKMAGYDGWLSIEHEDVLLNSLEGLEKSVALLQGVMPAAPADYQPQDI